ncbi:MAG: hypothetical protein QM780_12495 [Hyphomicrobium sp.]|uniref:hypothetical protein n=1 Tax=Hyphomicrobium sp. TaxID=82 RepID=UPI0039E714A6
MFVIEYVASPIGVEHPVLFDELALGSTVEEAKDQADTHLPAMQAKYGARGYRIFDRDKRRVATGPAGFSDG